ncbi:MAG: hypothetical protein R3C25_14105 [Hyphomonadaceae bacterium]
MKRFDPSRRHLLAGALAFSGVAPLPSPAFADEDEQITIAAPDGRSISLSIWRPQTVRAAVMFSHGSGGRPQNYPALMQTYRDAGLLVAAPLHVDSLEHPLRGQFDRIQTFRARYEDVVGALNTLQTMAPSAPQAVSGHSFGGLMSFVAGGGFPPMITGALPSVKAVVAFSDAGVIPNIVDENTYAGLTIPSLMITGDQDVIGAVSDWHEHLYPIEHSPAGDKVALVYAGGSHNLIGGARGPDANSDDAIADGADFVLAHAARDSAAMARIAALVSNDIRQVIRH